MAGYGMGASGVEGYSSPALGRLNVSCFEASAWEWGRRQKVGVLGGGGGLNPFQEASVLEFCGMFPSLP